MGGSSKSSSSSNQTTNTTNIDRRQAVAEGAIGISSDGATVNIESLDGGIVQAALDVVKANDVTGAQGYTALLGLADKLLSGAGEVISKQQDTTVKQIDQINTAAADAKGFIDNKTLVILAGVGAVAYLARKK